MAEDDTTRGPVGGHAPAPAPGSMRPVHDGADPEGEARARAEASVRTVLSWSTTAVGAVILFVSLGVLPGLAGWVFGLAVGIAVTFTLQLVAWPPIVRRATPWLVERRSWKSAR
ncbi:hypothetical protein [Luteimicrobium sp. DT211]|uniref:hypothetical protein n=1 Tax=Luteimicrobium sp. DT211 TaxID=3393412 RepID=UPI003CE7FFFD